MKQLTASFTACILALGLLMSAAKAYGSTQPLISVNIPFDFFLNDKRMPSGHYVVSEIDNHVLLFRDASGKHQQTLTVNSTYRTHASKDVRLIFHGYGNKYFLSQLWPSHGVKGNECMQTKAEKEAAAATRSTEVALSAVSMHGQ